MCCEIGIRKCLQRLPTSLTSPCPRRSHGTISQDLGRIGVKPQPAHLRGDVQGCQGISAEPCSPAVSLLLLIYTRLSSIPGFCTNCFLCLECSSAGLTPSWLILLLQVFAMPHILDEAFVVVQLLSHVRLFATPWTAACQTSLSFTISRSLLKLMSIELVMPSNHLILCHPLLLPSVFLSIRVFSN